MSSFLDIERNNKFVNKYLSLAKFFGDRDNPCYSRQIGVVITDSNFNKILATGYNGPPRGIPHCDTPEHFREILIPQLTEQDKFKLCSKIKCRFFEEEKFIETYAYQKICPRKIINCKSGERLNLCTCVHAEANAIVNASTDLSGSFMFAWCPLPCIECTKLIINAGIKKLFCYKEDKDYSYGSRYLFEKSGIEVYELDRNNFSDTQV